MITRKRHFTILETLIAMTLLCVFMVMIFGFFRELTTITRMTEVRQHEAFKTRYVESRLAFAFERVANENQASRKFFFFIDQPGSQTKYPSLVFTFNNEVRINPQFSGDVLARLFIDDEKQLCLATWPLLVESPYEHMQKEVLLENVSDIQFALYAAPSKESQELVVSTKKIDTEHAEPERNVWHQNEWLKPYKQMPSIIKITVYVDSKPLTFAFVLPSSKNPIFYPSGGGSS